MQQKYPWNKGKIIGQKRPFSRKDIWAIRHFLETEGETRDLALFNLGLDSKLRGCDLVALKVSDIVHAGKILNRATVVQSKTHRAVRFELTKPTRVAIALWLSSIDPQLSPYIFPSKYSSSGHLTPKQYSRRLQYWVAKVGLDPCDYGGHSLRRTKATLIYRETKNLRAVQLLLGHQKLDSTVRYLGIDLDDALDLSESIDI
ncbi:tyrosine-type recombinase/integrase [Dongshaea marina]|uniref:tyrosine-type recombinase/integrase n=1 Tax=Dongshaea marina TaxID=2047966 RepID=UPI000D3E969A|nr:tyrosine-type recombinase/integrase [Dongshaea marina]